MFDSTSAPCQLYFRSFRYLQPPATRAALAGIFHSFKRRGILSVCHLVLRISANDILQSRLLPDIAALTPSPGYATSRPKPSLVSDTLRMEVNGHSILSVEGRPGSPLGRMSEDDLRRGGLTFLGLSDDADCPKASDERQEYGFRSDPRQPGCRP